MAGSDRAKALETTLATIQKRYGEGSIMRLGDDVLAERGLAGALRAVDLDDASAGDASDAERQVKGQRAGGDHVDVQVACLPQAHDRAFSIPLLDAAQRRLQRLQAPALFHARTSIQENMEEG